MSARPWVQQLEKERKTDPTTQRPQNAHPSPTRYGCGWSPTQQFLKNRGPSCPSQTGQSRSPPAPFGARIDRRLPGPRFHGGGLAFWQAAARIWGLSRPLVGSCVLLSLSVPSPPSTPSPPPRPPIPTLKVWTTNSPACTGSHVLVDECAKEQTTALGCLFHFSNAVVVTVSAVTATASPPPQPR